MFNQETIEKNYKERLKKKKKKLEEERKRKEEEEKIKLRQDYLRRTGRTEMKP